MSKKLIILFILTFFLSTTGLPISLHYCQMQGSMSLSDCNMCSSKEVEEESSYCENEDNYPVQFKNESNNKCCELKIIESSVKDNFTVAASDWKTDKDIFITVYLFNNNHYNFKINQVHYNFTDSSPPFTFNKIYLLNSLFLI